MSAAQDLHDFESTQLDSHWLFRQGDLVLGPVSGHQVVEKLYTGELTGDSEVSSSGPSGFRKLKELEAFQLHAAKAAVKVKVEAEARLAHSTLVRRRLFVVGGVAVMLGLLGLGAWQVARHAAVYLPDDEPSIHVEPPKISFARPSVPEELLEYPGEPKRAPSRSVSRPAVSTPDKAEGAEKPEKSSKAVALASASPAPGSTSRRTGSSGTRSRKSSSPSDPDGLQMMATFDQAAINRVVKKHQPSLFRCFKEEAQRNPGFSARIPLEFSIGNDGRVAKLWVDHPRFKKGPLYECLFGELRKWPFKPYEGERATVNLSFTIGKKG